MIAGAMPKWQQYSHRSPVVMVILFGALIWWGVHSAPSHQPQGHNVWAITWMIVLGLGFIGSGIWFWKRLIKEFNYDGRTFTFNTLASSETQVRDVSAIEEVGEWTARGGAGILHKVPRRSEALPTKRCIKRGGVGGAPTLRSWILRF
jgi:hypothetical protein